MVSCQRCTGLSQIHIGHSNPQSQSEYGNSFKQLLHLLIYHGPPFVLVFYIYPASGGPLRQGLASHLLLPRLNYILSFCNSVAKCHELLFKCSEM